jgi:epoxyqueuosine reductase
MKKDFNRREFMKVTAQGMAVTGLAGLAPVSTIAQASAAEFKKSKIDAAQITTLIKDYVNTAPTNSIKDEGNLRIWDEPLVGFSMGSDPIYQFYKDSIASFHWTPLEAFNIAYPNIAVKPEELAVISFVLPHTEPIKKDQREKMLILSEKWIKARYYGGLFIDELSNHVADVLTKSGHQAFVPFLLNDIIKSYVTKEKEKWYRNGFAVNWSERHAAYASGLGTFGLCDGLITEVGKAIRCGSVIAKISIPATPRPYNDHHAYCLYFSKGTCGKCIERCPAGTITKQGHDKMACHKENWVSWEYANKILGFDSYGCGFCQTGVPCESGIPV